MLETATLDFVIVNISLNEICLISDTETPRYVTWQDTETFLYLWKLLQTIKKHTQVSYVYSVESGVRL